MRGHQSQLRIPIARRTGAPVRSRTASPPGAPRRGQGVPDPETLVAGATVRPTHGSRASGRGRHASPGLGLAGVGGRRALAFGPSKGGPGSVLAQAELCGGLCEAIRRHVWLTEFVTIIVLS